MGTCFTLAHGKTSKIRNGVIAGGWSGRLRSASLRPMSDVPSIDDQDAAAAEKPSGGSSSLAEGLDRRGLHLPSQQVEMLERYARLLWDWNTKINLTRHTDWDRFIDRDVVDSLELAKLLDADERVLDVGTGGGVPGVVLAILRPDLHVSLIDSVGKKARVVEDIVQQLGLDAPVYQAAVRDHLGDEWYDTLTIRAVASLDKLLTWFKGQWGGFGRLLLIKGPAWVEERNQARHKGLLHGLELRRRTAYPMPGTSSESVILEIRPPAEA